MNNGDNNEMLDLQDINKINSKIKQNNLCFSKVVHMTFILAILFLCFWLNYYDWLWNKANLSSILVWSKESLFLQSGHESLMIFKVY